MKATPWKRGRRYVPPPKVTPEEMKKRREALEKLYGACGGEDDGEDYGRKPPNRQKRADE